MNPYASDQAPQVEESFNQNNNNSLNCENADEPRVAKTRKSRVVSQAAARPLIVALDEGSSSDSEAYSQEFLHSFHGSLQGTLMAFYTSEIKDVKIFYFLENQYNTENGNVMATTTAPVDCPEFSVTSYFLPPVVTSEANAVRADASPELACSRKEPETGERVMC